ncbi:MAG: DUF1800 family protein [Alphaproteobacteria bacterium]|nr:DUF1800 family protein [Alphaproteobacteria bacterium]
MTSSDAFIAANRFGLGPRPGELAAIGKDPRGWIGEQISIVNQVPPELRNQPSSASLIRGIHEARMQGPENLKKMARKGFRKTMLTEIVARTQAQIRSPQPFRERMVLFWANHFTVSTTKGLIGPTIGAYEREAIRPHIFGRFEDMLLAATHHPTMLSYLDNNISFGPGSRVGKRRGRGLNENLAREILELHTLGVNGGYSQSDVTEFAKILTGWTHGGTRGKKSIQRLGPVHGNFEFRDIFHEPGPKTLLGKRYAENGEQEGVDALKDIARHPATAKFIAAKLARHFIADDPPADAVKALETAFRQSGGHLGQVSQKLIELDAVWNEPLPKVKTPHELVVSTLRAVAFDDIEPRLFFGIFREMGQSPFSAPSPAGWPDQAKDWMSPEALLRRVEWLRALAARLPRSLNPDTVAGQTIGPVMSARTEEMIAAAPSGEEALALLFASPEFQRR